MNYQIRCSENSPTDIKTIIRLLHRLSEPESLTNAMVGDHGQYIRNPLPRRDPAIPQWQIYQVVVCPEHTR